MLKQLFLISCILFSLKINLIAQNTFPDFEREFLSELMNQGAISQSEVDIKVNNVSKFYAKHPQLQNLEVKNGMLKFDRLINIPGINKNRLYKRIKEFTAIYYGNIDAVLHYEDASSGTIILKGIQQLVKNTYISDWNAMFSSEAIVLKYLNKINFIVKIRVDDNWVKIELMEVDLIGPGETAISQGIPINQVFPFVRMKSENGIKSAAEAVEAVVNGVNYHFSIFSEYLLKTSIDDNWKEKK